MTPLHALLQRFLPPAAVAILLGLVYSLLVAAVIICMTWQSQAFIYL